MFFKAGARTIPNHDTVVRTIMGMIYPTHLWWFWGYVCIEGCDTLCRWGSAQHRRYVKGWTYFTCYDEMDIPDIPEPGDFIKSTQKWLSHFNVPSASPTSTVRIQAPQSSASKQVTNQSIKNKRTNKRTNKQTNKKTKNTCTEYVLLLCYFNTLSLCVYIYILYIRSFSCRKNHWCLLFSNSMDAVEEVVQQNTKFASSCFNWVDILTIIG